MTENKLQFPSEYFEDQVRCGFYVPPIMKQLWGAELELLSELDRVCKKHGIKYFADWGTLIGAVRHGGFIPWDDDIDVCMLREDYIKFQQVAEAELGEGFEFYNYKNRDNHWLFLGKIINKNRICYEKEHLEKFHNFPYIVSIDIFVLDYVSSDMNAARKQSDDFKYVYTVATMMDEENGETKVRRVLPEVEKRSGEKIFPGLKGIELKRRLFEISENILKRFSKADGGMVSQLFPSGIMNINDRWPGDIYENYIEMPFEVTTVPAPMKFNEMLHRKYGNYMTFNKGGGAHEYPYFKEQAEKVKEFFDFEVPEYKFDLAQLPENAPKNQGYKELSKECLIGLKQLTENAMWADVQQLAVDMGTMLENVLGEGTETVSILEQLCEMVYNVTIGVTDALQVQDLLSQLEEKLKSEVLSRKEILFVVSKAENWKVIEKIYDRAFRQTLKDGSAIVNVLPVPYYDKRYDGSFALEHFAREKYPEGIKVMDYNEYDLEMHHPEEIYFDNSYDNWNLTTSIHPRFYSENLQPNCEKLIYVHCLRMDDFTKKDIREYYNSKYFITMPGVARADEVIVNSDKMAKIYVEKWCDFAGEEVRDIFSKKMEITKQETSKQEIADKESTKKRILFAINASFLQENPDEGVEKIERSFEIFRTNSDNFEVIFCQHPYLEMATKQVSGRLWEKYVSLISNALTYDFVIENNELWDMTGRDKTDRGTIDAYYGNEGVIATECMIRNIPTMIMSTAY